MDGRNMDWREERRRVLKHAKRMVVKVGSAVLTGEDGLDLGVVESLASQVSQLHDQGLDVAMVTSGAVAAGRKVVCNRALGMDASAPQCELSGMPLRQAASAIGQSRLMHAYDEAFSKLNKVTAQILLTRDDLESRRRFLNARNTFASLFEWRVVPICNENDTVMVEELEYGDNDSLAALLLNLVEADLFVNLTSAAGVFSANPMCSKGAECLDHLDDIGTTDLDKLCGGKEGRRTAVGRGGMYSKLMAARRAAQLGVPTLILAGREPNALTRAFAGEDVGTFIRADKKTISRRKFWLAYNRDPMGTLYVDQGAARALDKGGKSLLPIGIVSVDGDFGRGDLVRIVRKDTGEELGVGLVNYKAADLQRIAGLRSDEIEDALGYSYLEAVHRDNLLLHAAL